MSNHGQQKRSVHQWWNHKSANDFLYNSGEARVISLSWFRMYGWRVPYLTIPEPFVKLKSLLLHTSKLEFQAGNLCHQLQLLSLQRWSAQELLRNKIYHACQVCKWLKGSILLDNRVKARYIKMDFCERGHLKPTCCNISSVPFSFSLCSSRHTSRSLIFSPCASTWSVKTLTWRQILH